MEGTKET